MARIHVPARMRAITVRSVVFDRAVETAVVAERDDETSLRALSAEDVETNHAGQ